MGDPFPYGNNRVGSSSNMRHYQTTNVSDVNMLGSRTVSSGSSSAAQTGNQTGLSIKVGFSLQIASEKRKNKDFNGVLDECKKLLGMRARLAIFKSTKDFAEVNAHSLHNFGVTKGNNILINERYIAYWVDKNQIGNILSTMRHELTHSIQYTEKFSGSKDESEFLAYEAEILSAKKDLEDEKFEILPTSGQIEHAFEALARHFKNMSPEKQDNYRKYQEKMSECESALSYVLDNIPNHLKSSDVPELDAPAVHPLEGGYARVTPDSPETGASNRDMDEEQEVEEAERPDWFSFEGETSSVEDKSYAAPIDIFIADNIPQNLHTPLQPQSTTQAHIKSDSIPAGWTDFQSASQVPGNSKSSQSTGQNAWTALEELVKSAKDRK